MNEIIRPTEDPEYRAEQIKKIKAQMAAEIENQQRRKAELALTALRDRVIAGERLLNFEFFTNGDCAPFITIAIRNGYPLSEQCGTGFYPISSGNPYSARDIDW